MPADLFLTPMRVSPRYESAGVERTHKPEKTRVFESPMRIRQITAKRNEPIRKDSDGRRDTR